MEKTLNKHTDMEETLNKHTDMEETLNKHTDMEETQKTHRHWKTKDIEETKKKQKDMEGGTILQKVKKYLRVYFVWTFVSESIIYLGGRFLVDNMVLTVHVQKISNEPSAYT